MHAQVENELYGASDQYVEWCGDMAHEELQRAGLRVPVLMCNGQSAQSTINTCNAKDCVPFLEASGQNGRVLVDQPPLLTELEGGYQTWGESVRHVESYFYGRPAEDTAFAVARWFARGGALVNYYMAYGGNNYGRIAGNSMTTAYAQDAPICPDGLPHEPHFSLFAQLNRVLAARAASLLACPAQLRNGTRLEWRAADAWKSNDANLTCFAYGSTAFLENAGTDALRTVRWRGAEYTVPPQSMLIVDADAAVTLFNSSATSEMRPALRVIEPARNVGPLRWEAWPEPLSPAETSSSAAVLRRTPAEQTSITRGRTDFLWYETNVTLPTAVTGPLPLRATTSTSLSLVAWLNGTLAAARPAENHDHDAGLSTVQLELDLSDSTCEGLCLLTLLSVTIGGAPNYPVDPNSTRFLRGIVGDVTLGGFNITEHASPWRMRPGLVGERRVFDGSVQWAPAGDRASWPPGTWLRARFPTPSPLPPNSATLLNLTGLGRGRVYVNGHDAGRYWLLPRNDGSGPSQRFYHVPPDWLADAGALNELIVFEDESVEDLTLVGVAVSHMIPTPLLVQQRAAGSRVLLHAPGDVAAARAVTPCVF